MVDTRSVTLLIAALLLQDACPDYPPPRELYTLSWVGAPFTWPSTTVRNMYKTSGQFVPKNMIATRAAIYGDYLFAVFPRYHEGVAATLARASLLGPNYEAVFSPFPGWEAQAEGEDGALQNVVDVCVDRRDVLWTLDTGLTETLDRPVRRSVPRARGYEPLTGRELYNIDLSEFTSSSSRLQYIVSDSDSGLPGSSSGGRRYLYISDAGTRALIVYNVSEGVGYRAVLPDTLVTGCPYPAPDVLYLVIAKTVSGEKRLFVTSLSGEHLFSVPAADLQTIKSGELSVQRVGTKPDKMVIIGADASDIYFRFEGAGDVYAWDVNTDFDKENFKLAHAGDYGLLATHAVLDPLRGKMRLLQSNFLDYFQNTVGVGALHTLCTC